jgi:hypothetical protein
MLDHRHPGDPHAQVACTVQDELVGAVHREIDGGRVDARREREFVRQCPARVPW